MMGLVVALAVWILALTLVLWLVWRRAPSRFWLRGGRPKQQPILSAQDVFALPLRGIIDRGPDWDPDGFVDSLEDGD
jgi:hypothetical protein